MPGRIGRFATRVSFVLGRLFSLSISYWIISFWYLFLASAVVGRSEMAMAVTTVPFLWLRINGILGSLVWRGDGHFIDSSMPEVVVDASLEPCKHHSSTALSTNLPTFSATRKMNSVLDSTIRTISIATAIYWTISSIWASATVELRPDRTPSPRDCSFTLNKAILRPMFKFKYLACRLVSSKLDSTVLLIANSDCTTLFHFFRRVSTIASTSVLFTTPKSTNRDLTLLLEPNDSLTMYFGSGCCLFLVASESLLITIPSLPSAGLITIYPAKARSINYGTAPLPAIAAVCSNTS